MDKNDIRKAMYALSTLKLSDEDALKYISRLAKMQMYKSPKYFAEFCLNCGIAYSGCPGVLFEKFKTMNDNEVRDWSEKFMEECSYINMALR